MLNITLFVALALFAGCPLLAALAPIGACLVRTWRLHKATCSCCASTRHEREAGEYARFVAQLATPAPVRGGGAR